MTAAVMTTYKFSLKPQVTDADFLQASEKVQTFLGQWPGFQYRSVAKTESQQWLDVNYWENQTLLGNMDEAFSTHADCQAFMSMIDLDNMEVTRAQVLLASACTDAA